jgi:hypothetical protein
VKYLVIDTNIYLFCSFGTRDNYEPELLHRIKGVLDQPDVCLLVPEVVELEYRRNVRSQADQYAKSVEAAAKSASDALMAQADRTAIDAEFARIKRDRREATDLAQRYFDEILAHAKTRRVEIVGEDVARALALSIAGTRPSKGKTASVRADVGEGDPGYAIEPDCLIVSCVARQLHEARANAGDTVIFCSDNKKDFGKWAADGQPPTLQPSIEELMPCRSSYYVGLDELLDSEFQGIQMTDDERAKYAEAAEATLATQSNARRWLVHCLTCGTQREVDAPVAPDRCSECGGLCQCDSIAPAESQSGTNRRFVCPTCGNLLQARVNPGRDKAVRRWCLNCLSRLQLEPGSGAVSVLGAADPLDAEPAGRERGILILACPLCGRTHESFAKTRDSRYFAYCGNPDHGDRLLVYRTPRKVDNETGLDTA